LGVGGTTVRGASLPPRVFTSSATPATVPVRPAKSAGTITVLALGEREAEAEAKATAFVSEAISKGDVNAINYFIAQKYVEAFGDLARSPNAKTVIVPADFAGLTGTVAGVAELVKTLGGNDAVRAPAVPPTPKRGA
jgi:hypothetical protein